MGMMLVRRRKQIAKNAAEKQSVPNKETEKPVKAKKKDK